MVVLRNWENTKNNVFSQIMLFKSPLDWGWGEEGECSGTFRYFCFECVCVFKCGGWRGRGCFFLFGVCFITKIFLAKVPSAGTFFLETSKIKYESVQGKRDFLKSNTFGGRNNEIWRLAQTWCVWFEASDFLSLSLSFHPTSGKWVCCNKANLTAWLWA